MRDIYLDHNATTRLDPEVLEVMLSYMSDRFGNAASSNRRGRAASAAVGRAREQLAGLVGVSPQSVVWTSGSTEAINTVVKGLPALGPESNLVVSAGEHKAVLDATAWLAATRGCELRIAPLQRRGDVDYAALADLIDASTVLVAVMSANNETGALTDTRTVVDIAHERGAFVLCDTTQHVGKLPLDVADLGADFAVASAHKVYGPQGVGALIAATSTARRALTPLIHGGGHEGGLRSGTINLPGVIGFGAAAEIAQRALSDGASDRVAALRDSLEYSLVTRLGDVTVNVRGRRLPNTTNLRIHNVEADALIANCPAVAMSSGSACTSAVPSPSHVLLAMGLTEIESEESIRLSLGRFTTREEIDAATDLIGDAVRHVRRLSA